LFFWLYFYLDFFFTIFFFMLCVFAAGSKKVVNDLVFYWKIPDIGIDKKYQTLDCHNIFFTGIILVCPVRICRDPESFFDCFNVFQL